MLRAPISLAGSTRRGMVTTQVVLVSLSFFIIPWLALVADGGLLLVERRHAQATADAVALAAASDLYAYWNTNHGTDPSGTALASALGVASANGYTNDGTTFESHGQHLPREVFRRTQCRHDFATGIRRGNRDLVSATRF